MAGDWLIPDDGYVDLVAVAAAAAGDRPVRLTPAEQRMAAARIMAETGNITLICQRLHVSVCQAAALLRPAASLAGLKAS